MLSSDLLFAIQWWGILFVVGLLFLPSTFFIFQKFADKGYIFSRVLGVIVLSYLTLFLGILHIVSFTKLNLILLLIFLFGLHVVLALLKKINIFSLIRSMWRLILFEEIMFFLALISWSYVRGNTPEIHGLEKYMDFGFVNSILRADYFPPKDMWFTPFSINYYYFGHLITAVLTKLSSIPSQITYNLMIATLFAFTFTQGFSICLNLIHSFLLKKESENKQKIFKFSIIAGLIAGFLIACAGNLHTLYTFFKPYQNENPVPFWELVFSPLSFPNSYWYPNATRFIHNTIHEFPLYSFVVSDLHGHVLSIPIVLTIIAVLFHTFLVKKINLFILILLSFLLATAYMTNAWDGIIYFLLTLFVFVYFIWQKGANNKSLNITVNPFLELFPFDFLRLLLFKKWVYNFVLGLLIYVFLLGIGFIIFSLPFSLFFKPFVSGIGVLCAPEFLTKIGNLGPFLFEKDHCQHSPFWQLMVLYGFFYFFVISFLVFLWKKIVLTKADTFVLILITLSTILIIVPEFIYAKDIYPAHYRANTMFKLVYQSFMMLSISSAYIFIRIFSEIKLKKNIRQKPFIFLLFSLIFLILVMIYPYFAIRSYYGELKNYQGLDGITYLKNSYPTDYDAILWLQKNIKGQPVILEAQGDSYTDFARVSSNTGLPTVLGWTVHEWLWRGSYEIPAPRIEEVKNLYESTDIELTKTLIKKYNIKLIFIGDLETQKYSLINEPKFDILGDVIYRKGATKIYQLR